MIRTILIAALVLLASCSKDEPQASNIVDPPTHQPGQPDPADSSKLATAPQPYSTAVAGSWTNHRTIYDKGYSITFAQAGAWCTDNPYGSWAPVMDLRLIESGTKIWVDLVPAPFPGEAIRFCGTIYGDSCVGWERNYHIQPGGEFVRDFAFAPRPRTYYRR